MYNHAFSQPGSHMEHLSIYELSSDCKTVVWKYAINKASVYLYPAYKISSKMQPEPDGTRFWLLFYFRMNKKNDVVTIF